MKRKIDRALSLVGVGTVAMTLAGQAMAESASSTAKPNILLILADDAGYYDFGCQGSKEIPTPNVDSIAANGVRFTDGHVSATVCSPSRAGLITGRHQQRFGHEGNCPPHHLGMNVKEKTMGDTLKALGYKTAIFGKWHLGNKKEYYPTNRGFDVFYGMREGSRSYFYSPKGNDKPGDPHGYEHNGKQIKFEGYFTDELGSRCVDFINENKEQPFFAFLAFNAPHTPMHAKKEHLQMFRDKPRPTLTSMIWSMDENIGRVIKALKKNGQYENTIIWFLSDNGGTPTNRSCNWPLNGYKGNKFEGGHRVPFLMQWPAKIKSGQTFNGLTSSLDIHATALIAAGGKLPANRPLDGVDLLPYVTGQKSGNPHQKLFFRKENCAGMRDGDWKLIRVRDINPALFNLGDDIGEKVNLAAKYPERVQNMLNDMDQWEQGLTKPWWSEGGWLKITRKIHLDILKGQGGAANTVKKMTKRANK